MDLRIKRAEILDKLTRMQSEAEIRNMSPEVSKEFQRLLNDVDNLTNEIRFKDFATKLDESKNDDFQPVTITSNYQKNAAKRTLGDAFKMLAKGERSKIDNNFLLELGQRNGLSEYRTEYPSANTVETKLTNVFLEIVKDDRFLSRIPTETIREGYLKYPVVTRENYPVAEGKADADALTGSDTNFTSITLQPKNSYVLSRFHKDLVRDAGIRAYEAVWSSCRDAITKRLVQGILYGSSSNNGEFNGLDNVSGANIYDTSGGSILDYSLVTRGAKALNDKFVDHSEMIGLISPNTYQKFSDLRELASSGMYLTPPNQISGIPIIANPMVKTDYSTNKTRLYMMRPESSILALFGNFEIELNERYAEYDHAAALIVFRSDFAFLDPEHLFIATNLPT